MLRPNGEVVRVGMGFKPLDFSINDITAWNKSIIGHMAYDSTSAQCYTPAGQRRDQR